MSSSKLRNLVVLAGLSACFGPNASAVTFFDVVCIAQDGFEFRLPDSSNRFMQQIELRNGYSDDFLQDLIVRHAGQKTKDQDLALSVSFNVCQAASDAKITCKDQVFGGATYGYSLNDDYVTVHSPVSGDLSVELAQDAQGIYQLDLTITNERLPGNHVLHVQKTFGPKNDPTKSSLTPWTPGCQITL